MLLFIPILYYKYMLNVITFKTYIKGIYIYLYQLHNIITLYNNDFLYLNCKIRYAMWLKEIDVYQ